MALKASISSTNVVEASFTPTPPHWADTLRALPHVNDVIGQDHVFRIASDDGPATTMAVMQAAAGAGLTVQSLAVQRATLDDVFVHYAGRQLRDALQAPAAAERGMMPPRP